MANFLVTDLKVMAAPHAGLGVARCLKMAGHQVYGADETPFATTSDLFTETFVIKEFQTLNIQSLLQKLQTFHDVYSIDYIVPCYDETVILLASLRSDIESMGMKLICPDIASLRKIKKLNLPNLVSNELSSPPVARITNLHDAPQKAIEIGFPLYVKGLVKSAILVTDINQLEKAIKDIGGIKYDGTVDCLLQKVVEGQYRNALITYKNKTIAGYLEMEKIGVDPYGTTWFGKLTTDTDSYNPIQKLLQAIPLNDCIIEIEMIKRLDGIVNIIEINPRPPSWIYASSLNGMNFLEMYLQPSENTIFNDRPIYFGRENIEFIKELPDSYEYTAGGAKVNKGNTINKTLASDLLL